MKHLSKLLLLLALVGALASCESSTSVAPPTVIVPHDTVTSTDRVLFIEDEGQFGSNNSALDAVIFRNTLHIHDSGTVHDTVRGVDTIIRTGSTAILTDMGEANDSLVVGKSVVVLDNGGRLRFVDADALTQSAALDLGPTSPNKMALVGSNQILVTERADSLIPIIDISNRTVVKTINVGKSNAAVGVLGGKIFVTISEYQKPGSVVITDVANTSSSNTLPIGSGPEEVIVDSANNQVIVRCDGDNKSVPPAVYFIDGTTLKIKDSIVLGNVGAQTQCFLGDKLYAINGGQVISIDPVSQTVLGTVVTADGATAYYNGYYHLGNLYLGISDFSGPTGKVDVVDAATGKFKWQIITGIAPAHFAFYH